MRVPTEQEAGLEPLGSGPLGLLAMRLGDDGEGGREEEEEEREGGDARPRGEREDVLEEDEGHEVGNEEEGHSGEGVEVLLVVPRARFVDTDQRHEQEGD